MIYTCTDVVVFYRKYLEGYRKGLMWKKRLFCDKVSQQPTSLLRPPRY